MMGNNNTLREIQLLFSFLVVVEEVDDEDGETDLRHVVVPSADKIDREL